MSYMLALSISEEDDVNRELMKADRDATNSCISVLSM
jgi:hypothetical protein